MNFSFETIYDHGALTAMSRALRKLYRRKNSVITRVFMIAFLLFGIYFSTPLSGNEFSISASKLICYATLILIFVMLLWEDGINAVFARKRLPRREYLVYSEFNDDGFTIKVGDEVSYCAYQRIQHLAETKYFYIFTFNENRAEIFDKEGLAGITEEEFCAFIREKAEKEFERV